MKHLVWLLCLLLIVPDGNTAIAVVNATSGEASANGNSIAAAAFATTAGNLLFAIVGLEATAAPTDISLSNTGGDSWTSCSGILNLDTTYSQVWYAKNIAGNASDVVTATWTAVANNSQRGIAVVQYSGLHTTSPLDVNANSQTGYNDNATSATYSTADANEAIASGIYGADAKTYTAGTAGGIAMTKEVNDAGGLSASFAIEDAILSSTQTNQTTTMTWPGGQNYIFLTCSFIIAAAAAGGIRHRVNQ